MMAGRGSTAAVGGPARHIPVMLSEVLAQLDPKDGDIIVDGTFGAGGYSKAILDHADCKIIAIDRDPEAFRLSGELAAAYSGRVLAVLGRYSEMVEIAASEGFSSVEGVVLDLGVSSMQLDQPARGFSFSQDGPLDMRMGQGGPSARDIVNRLGEQELAEILFKLGEERAEAVRRYLSKQGIALNRMSTISYGKERPVAVCNDISCWSQNRRAVTTVNSHTLPIVKLQSICILRRNVEHVCRSELGIRRSHRHRAGIELVERAASV